MDRMNEFWVLYQGPTMNTPAILARRERRDEALSYIKSSIRTSENTFPGRRTQKQRRALYTIREVLPL